MTILLIGLAVCWMAGDLDEPRAKKSPRAAWDARRFHGTPEPPPPLRAAPAYPKLKFKNPLFIAKLPDRPVMLVVEQLGRIVSFPDTPNADRTAEFLVLKDHETYGLTFDPAFARNRYVYVFSNGPDAKGKKFNRIERYAVTAAEPPQCNPGTRLLIIEWASNGHNGGDLAFGPDGMLYITSGDGTSDSDGDNTGQDIRDLCSGMLRIDVRRATAATPYLVPDDNPFLATPGARPELWAFGFRNPWRLAFDDAGRLWVGDIGQDQWEMIQLVERGSNHGWSVREGSRPFHPHREKGPGEIRAPAVEHAHAEARSITGGVIQRGRAFPEFFGMYIYGDYSTGKIWGFRYRDGKVVDHRELADTAHQILGFGHDSQGETVFVDYAGSVHRLERSPPVDPNAPPFPRGLSETGLFADVARHRVHAALFHYDVNSPLWSDGATKDRYIALPNHDAIEFTPRGAWKFPEFSVLVKTFSLPNAGAIKRVETRLMVQRQGEWTGYTYRWRDDQSDADLVSAAGEDRDIRVDESGATTTRTWRYPSRAECMMCHSRAAGFVLGLSTEQMNRPCPDAPTHHQMTRLLALGMLKGRGAEVVKVARAHFESAKVLAGWGWRQLPAAARRRLQARYGKPAMALAAWCEARIQPLAKKNELVSVLPGPSSEFPQLANPHDAAAPVEARARAWLHVNCAVCHVEAGGGNAAIDLHFLTALEKTRTVDVKPMHHAFSLHEPRLIAPGAPDRSVLLHRVSHRGVGSMPPLATRIPDAAAIRLLREWIAAMPAAAR